MIQRTTILIVFVLATTLVNSSCKKRDEWQQTNPQDSLAHLQRTANQQTLEDITPTLNDQDIVFAYTDSTGHYLIDGDTDSLSRGPYFLITTGGDIVRLQHIGYRLENDHSTHRQVASNFQNEGGNLFHIGPQSLTPDKTYLIVSNRFLEKHNPLKLIELNYSPVDNAIIERIFHARARSVHQSWHVASLGPVGEVVIVLFEQNTSKPLASLVVVKDSPLIFEDYVGDASREGSVWRVDDGGEFDAKSIHIIAAFQSANGIELARTWAGPEGENEAFLSQSFNRFVPVIEAYRYWIGE